MTGQLGTPADSMDDPFDALRRTTEHLAEGVGARIRALGEAAISPLLTVLQDEELAVEESPAQGWPPLHAITVAASTGLPLTRASACSRAEHLRVGASAEEEGFVPEAEPKAKRRQPDRPPHPNGPPLGPGGGGGIRTHGTLASTPVFKTGAFNRSATPPWSGRYVARFSWRAGLAEWFGGANGASFEVFGRRVCGGLFGWGAGSAGSGGAVCAGCAERGGSGAQRGA